ncbi:MAG: roadblock/LC7 domain-containing protein [Nitrospirota bacterium]|nr:MAG: roadblock/LC7 domain-containing protein [Nitrospirota bacterium]
MNFKEVLAEVVDNVDGAVSAMIIASDGIPVEEHYSEKILDLSDLGAEASAMIKDIENAARELRLGDAREFSIISDLCGIVMRKINNDYYLGLVIKPDGNYGKGRFILKKAVPKLENEF